MPRYKLGIYKKDQSIYFDMEEFKNIKANDTLKEIDKFTMQFETESQLIEYLKNNNIYRQEKNNKIHILYNNGDVKRLPVLYFDSRKYMDVHYLRNLIQSYSKDIVFLEKLANHYSLGKSTYNPQLTNITAIRTYINDVTHSSTGESFYSQALNNILDDIIIKAAFKINKNTGEAQENYRGLRDLALFTKKYTEDKLKKEYEDARSNTTNGFEYNEKFEEPGFAPNSEEESMYFNYLESLVDEESDYAFENGKSR